MKKTPLLPRLTALALALALLLLPARALTVDQARELLRDNYVDPVPQEVLDQPTVPAMLEALGDPYTEYLTAQEYAAFLSSMEDATLGGIGITAAESDQGLLVSGVLDGCPAQAAGILPGDVLVEVDGVDIAGLGVDRAVALIQGEAGTAVRLTYLRQGVRRAVTLTRAIIRVPGTTGQLLEGGVGYIACETWGEDALTHFRELLGQMEDQVGCWLIDLRGNTGGLTSAATDAAGLFCGPGPMLGLRLRDESAEDGYVYQVYAAQDEALTDKPVVILVDGHTASASEAFCAALRDYGRGVVVGSRTYGKGVAQGLWDRDTDPDCFPDGDSLKITIARFYSPIGNTNHIIGVMPDVLTGDQETETVGAALARQLAQAGEDWPDEVDALLAEQVGDLTRFSDAAGHPYASAIAALAAYDLVQGKDDGLFHPEDALTRAELAQLLQNALNCPPAATLDGFSDVAEDAWYAQAAAAMESLGLMTGVGQDCFAPEETLTHQELFTVLGRLGRWLNDDLDLAVRTGDEARFSLRALADYDDWAKSSVWLLSCALENDRGGLVNLLWDDPEHIDPAAPATRAETAQALYTLLYYLSILP